jgi:hypothetical protein
MLQNWVHYSEFVPYQTGRSSPHGNWTTIGDLTSTKTARENNSCLDIVGSAAAFIAFQIY